MRQLQVKILKNQSLRKPRKTAEQKQMPLPCDKRAEIQTPDFGSLTNKTSPFLDSGDFFL